ncbi:MAG: hypothetical protein B7Z08_12845 [Sphingomonadales bacterium 32-68-7]|nr:MAG: hypothetical protein B7Z33_10800 [Sphingomonadales bacterium 12-68-11]OYX07169.1 MAG: hypothetical protein B7Z08_12845 [Sphingomonadales bacterium 32-68-7]
MCEIGLCAGFTLQPRIACEDIGQIRCERTSLVRAKVKYSPSLENSRPRIFVGLDEIDRHASMRI